MLLAVRTPEKKKKEQKTFGALGNGSEEIVKNGNSSNCLRYSLGLNSVFWQ